MVQLYFPHDEFSRGQGNYYIAADYLELCAYFSDAGEALTSDLINASEIGADGDYAEVDEEMTSREEIASAAVYHVKRRARILGDSYPFLVDDGGFLVTYTSEELSNSQAAYLLSLILSHLKSMSPVLKHSTVYPTEKEVADLRQYFQYFATAALAAEIRGKAWSFGSPRPDKSGFWEKLREIWHVLQDGEVSPDPSAPNKPNDDQIDVFAARPHDDELPGFLLAAAQVATGANWKEKSLRGHLDKAFPRRWFSRQPATDMLCYHVIPFDRPPEIFRDDVLQFGNVLHRLRVPRRVHEAEAMYADGVIIEAFDLLTDAREWLAEFSRRGVVAA